MNSGPTEICNSLNLIGSSGMRHVFNFNPTQHYFVKDPEVDNPRGAKSQSSPIKMLNMVEQACFKKIMSSFRTISARSILKTFREQFL